MKTVHTAAKHKTCYNKAVKTANWRVPPKTSAPAPSKANGTNSAMTILRSYNAACLPKSTFIVPATSNACKTACNG